MSIVRQLIENVVVERSPILRRDAEALLMAALWRDLPAAAIIEDTTPGESGCSIGSGHWLAQTAGRRPGTVAVRVAVTRLLRRWLEQSADDFDLAVDGATIDVERVAVHEIAHALVAPLDAEVDDEEALARVMRADEAGAVSTPERTMRGHPARWAAAYAIAAGRCAKLRPQNCRRLWRAWMVRDVERYGHDAAAIEDAVADAPTDVPLRELLSPSGEIAARLAAATRPEALRLDIIRRQMFDASPASEPLVAAPAAGVPMKEVFS